MARKLSPADLCLLLATGLACSGEPTEPPGPVASIAISPDSVSLVIGQSAQLRATALDAAGRSIPGAVIKWRSYDSLVPVSATGLVTALGTARTGIEASADEVYNYVLVKVPGVLAGISLSATDTVLPGDSLRFLVSFQDSAGNGLAPTPVTWSVSDTLYAKPGSEGYVVGRWPGVVTVMAASGQVVGSFNIRVLVPVASVLLSPTALTVAPGSTYFSQAILHDTAAGVITGRPVHWSPASGVTAQSDTQGFVTALAPGDADVVAGAEGHADTTALHVATAGYLGMGTGREHTCAISSDHAIWCWGTNQAYQLGVSGVRNISGPARVPGTTHWAAVRGGGDHTCALTDTGAAYCWGSNEFGQLGNGTTDSSAVPVAVAGSHTFVSLAVGGAHACGITTTSETYCWGSGLYGRLGDGTDTGFSSVPVLVHGGLAFTSITAGGDVSCGLIADGTAYCWGHGLDGVLGNGEFGDRAEPYPVFGGLKFQAISAGGTHACGVAISGSIHCWGRGDFGQIGNGGTGSGTPAQIQLSGVSFNALSVGVAHTCALATTGAVYCWGWNIYGQSGPGGGAIAQPVGLQATAVTTGGLHSCALSEGRIFCWGLNGSGQLGYGAPGAALPDNKSATPVLVTGQQ